MSRIDELCSDLNKQFGVYVAQKGVERQAEPIIPFSSVRVNYMFYGGFPRKGLVEFYGENNGGKTTLSLDLMGNAQKVFKKEWQDRIAELEAIKTSNRGQVNELAMLRERGPLKCVFVDAEHSLDEEWARVQGVDTEDMYWVRPQQQTAEEILEMILNFCRTGEVGLIVLDSIAKLVGQNIMEETLEKKCYGGIAIPVTAFCNKYDTLPLEQKPLVVIINQVREALGDNWAHYVTPGGQALKFACRLRVMVSKGKYLDQWGYEQNNSCENPQGNIVKLAVAKNKFCRPDRRTGQFNLMYVDGIDKMRDLIDTAVQLGIITKSGSWMSIIDRETGDVRVDSEGIVMKFQGLPRIFDYFRAHPEWMNGEFWQEINAEVSKKS